MPSIQRVPNRKTKSGLAQDNRTAQKIFYYEINSCLRRLILRQMAISSLFNWFSGFRVSRLAGKARPAFHGFAGFNRIHLDFWPRVVHDSASSAVSASVQNELSPKSGVFEPCTRCMRSRSQEMSDRECVGSTRRNSNWKRFARSRPANRWGPRPSIGHPQRLEHSNGLRQSAKGPIWTGHTCEQGRRLCALKVADRGADCRAPLWRTAQRAFPGNACRDWREGQCNAGKACTGQPGRRVAISPGIE